MLCKRCQSIYEDERAEYCDFCGMEASVCTCIPPNLLINGCFDYRKLVFYKSGGEGSPMRSMIYNVKRSYNLSLIKFFAKEIADFDREKHLENVVVTFSPRSQQALKEYGYDQAKLLAKYYARELGYVFRDVLKRKRRYRQSQQKLLNHKQRALNVRNAFYIRNEALVKGKTVVILDDVVTSGATLGECISVLYSSGAKNVICRSIAYTYRKNKRKK